MSKSSREKFATQVDTEILSAVREEDTYAFISEALDNGHFEFERLAQWLRQNSRA